MTTLTPNTGLQDVLNQDTVMMTTAIPTVTAEDLNFVSAAATGAAYLPSSIKQDDDGNNFTMYEELSRRYQYVMTVSDSEEDDEEYYFYN